MKPYIHDVYPLKAQFLRNQPITIAVELDLPFALDDGQTELEVKIYDLNLEIEVYRHEIGRSSPGRQTNQLMISPKDVAFKGFGVDVHLYLEEEWLQVSSTSFDVVTNWRQSPRYGFLSDFHPNEAGDSEDIKQMTKLHINLVQFYDWMYRHDDLVATVDVYSDLMGKVSSRKVIEEKIALCHSVGMKAIAYGAVYAASREFYEQHTDWALYGSNGKVLDFIHIFYLMNIAEESPWHRHIIEQYKRTIEELQFDGIHMDTYGSPKIAISKLANEDKIVRLDEHFPVLINNTRKLLEQCTEDLCLIFNNVGNWPVDTVACAEQDVIYIEVWKPYERYHHIVQILSWAQQYGKGKPVILAAYLKPFMEKGDASMDRANYAALILTAVISASGGYHLLLGENKGVLTQGYYVDYSSLSDAFFRDLRLYYDFIIRYATVLYDPELRDVSMTHVDGDNLEYVFEKVSYSTYGEANKVWTLIKEKPGLKVVNLINLCGVSDDYWNTGKQKPTPQNDFSLTILLESEVKSVFISTPDNEMGRPQQAQYEIEDRDRGKTLVLTIPHLDIWSLVVIELLQ
ncbi:glycoside hydrolase family 66 protein [Paenibacillus sp. Soil766]|uniref:glycoside hydrolase family 66 protein n=1 Tax=Paenibacillus sp. Soil766 TaxID=1736404 RepID=UPI0007C71F4B|nr:glycoside hydrolase family 66 protein [Paenibacillus sp. Soil766]